MMMDRCRKRKWDSGSYKFGAFVLDNGLSVLLVSSVELEHGAASLAIGCGSFADPLHIQGLAHLFEHVLFLGSQAYPGLNEFNDFVHQHGGEVAAETKLDHSIFSMHVFSDHFEGALNMFVDMFMNPTMDSGFIKRDLNTIDSEFLLHKYKDSACQEHLFYHTASNTHPFKRFTWGNKEFLSKESLCSEVKKLFYDYYKASNMKLVIISPDELGYLENLVRELFANLQNHTDLKEESRRPPIVSSESFCSLLKSKGWVTRFGASVGSDTSFVCHDSDSTYGSTSVGEVFVVQADLTNTGWEMRYEVVTCVLQYLNFLSGYYPHDSLIDEYNTSLLMKYYRLFDKIGELYFFAQGLAVNMLKAPTKHALSLHFEYVFGKKPEMDGILRLLTPQNMRVDCLSKPFTETEFQQESYFGAKYKIEDIPLEYITKWQKNSIDIDLSFPALNEFMPSEFLSKIELFRSSGQNSSQFELCMDEDFGKLFHSENSSAIWPLAEFNIYTNVPDIKSQWSSKIFIEMIKEDLSAILYNGAEACIDAIISFGDNNILELRFNGFGEKLKDFISKIWQSFGLFTPTKECFKIMKDKMQSEFISRDLNEQAFQLLSNKLTEDITLDDKLDWLKKITFEDVQHINFSSKGRVKRYLQYI
ncbi:unnamed protein product [Arabis nemorensis]|uniref:Peptidase M16 N-terminal domain-containing protein n=1 Tax=Arabis nemorensis TaxID=586526 RepID=A0A565CJY7_9BRAS|nr:unnamed protein product [Arabis nemorensis]